MSLDLTADKQTTLRYSINGHSGLLPETHAVLFYDEDAALLETLARFIGTALVSGDAAIVLATEAHRHGLVALLRERGLDVDGAAAPDRYVALDAAEILAQITPNGHLDEIRFADIIGGIIERTTIPGRRFVIFGELVALLCAAGQPETAVRLEQLWKELARSYAFSLMCAYPTSAFPWAADSASFDAICAEHTEVTPADDLAALPDEASLRRAIAALQQRARALENEVRARAEAEALLRRHEAELAAIIDSSEDAIISKTLDGIITSWNHAAERLYGYTADEIVGRPIATIVPEDRRAELAHIMARLTRGKRIAHHETVRVHKDGTRIDVSVSISPIHDRAGRIIGASKIARDIRERRALERQRQEFVEMVAHDLGSPLTVITGYAQILQRRRAYDEQKLAKIVAEAGRMGRMVSGLLEVTQLEAGRLELRRAPMDLVALARDCATQAALVAGGRRVRVAAPEEPVVGEWDHDRVEQVLTNLLDNALKYASDGDVEVRVVALPGEAQVSVTDHGPGLGPEELERVFGHYFRSSRTAKSTSGSGLGLFISKALVEAHGGRIRADSALDQGSTFAFALPYAADKPAAAEL